jgi:hypothetical protein
VSAEESVLVAGADREEPRRSSGVGRQAVGSLPTGLSGLLLTGEAGLVLRSPAVVAVTTSAGRGVPGSPDIVQEHTLPGTCGANCVTVETAVG